MPFSQAETRPAATVMLLRPGDRGPEVLMVTRQARGFFGGLIVFPGGAVDPTDQGDLAARAVAGSSPEMTFRVAALRELAEETGIALTTEGPRPAPAGRGPDLLEEIGRMGSKLDADALELVSRWVTPEYAPKRFDTRFFLADGTGSPAVRLDRDELVTDEWLIPSDALARHEDGELKMFTPTLAHLRWLADRSSIEQAMSMAAGASGRSLLAPHLMEDGSIVEISLPGAER
jgi:8-oxo-dGTP pyrophosphatase MutT (NUDIX family)